MTKREEVESKLFSSMYSGSTSPSECVAAKYSLSSSQMPAQVLSSIVGEDGTPDANTEHVHEKRQTNNFVCPRCEREFPYTEESKWKLHCKRCTDD